jgi:RHS repeat-associated protein
VAVLRALPVRNVGWSRWLRRPWVGVSVAALMMAVALVAVPTRAPAAAAGGAELAPGSVDQNSGAFATSVELRLPSFHGVEPKLALMYSSSGANGVLGVGWQLAGASAISRTGPGRGAPTYTASDVFQLDGDPLVASTALGGTYVTKRQSFQRISFDATANAWSVWSKNGTKSTYAARLDVASGKTVRWMLSSVADLHGNTVSYGYWCDGTSECYLNTVSYNGTVVTLYREARPDPLVSAAGGAMVTTSYRVKTIDVVVSGARARTYALAYVQSPTTGRSMLASVTRYGRDATVDTTGAVTGSVGTVTGGSAQRPISLTYQVDTSTFTTGPVFAGFCDTSGQIGTGDFNGDGNVDLSCYSAGTATTSVALSDGLGGFTAGAAFTGFCDTSARFGVGDFNGDGKTDLWCHSPGTSSTTVALSDGLGGFTTAAAFTGFCDASGQFGVGDFDGDGKTDLWCHAGGTRSTTVAFSNGLGGFTAAAVFSGWCDTSGQFGTGDFNGDGKTDFWCHAAGTSSTSVGLSNGTGGVTVGSVFSGWCDTSGQFGTGEFNGDGKTDFWCHAAGTASTSVALSDGAGGLTVGPAFTGFCDTSGTFATGDFNGDGRTDLLCHAAGTATTTTAYSNGIGGFVAAMSLTTWCDTSGQFGTGDFNGDGKTDLSCHTAGTASTTVAMSGSRGVGDLEASVTNELGGKATVTYTAAAVWPVGTLEPGLQPPPHAWLSASRVQVSDGLALSTDTHYAYSAGRWDPIERRFLGYEKVTATDVSGATTVTSFRVAAGFATNRVSQVDRNSTAAALLERSTTTYGETVSGGVYTSVVASTTHSWCAGATVCQTTRSDRLNYDAYGNSGLLNEYNDTAVTGDERSTVTVFALVPATYLVDRPASMTVHAGLGGTGAQLGRTEFDYTAAGDVKATRRWLNTTNTLLGTAATYDAYGNEVSATDEVGHVMSYTFDPTYHLFSDRMCQALASCDATVCAAAGALCTTHTWDGVLGVRTSTTGVNGDVTSWKYDAFGRVILETRPDATTTTTTYVSWGTPGSQYVQTAVSDGSVGGLWKRVYPDGQGRTVKTVDKPDRTVLTVYNAQGLMAKVSNLFAGTTAPVYTSYTYDALGRQTLLTHPDGSTVVTVHNVLLTAGDADFSTAKLITRTCNEMGVCTRVGYNGAGNPVVTSEWDGVGVAATVPEYRTHTAFDLLGNTTKITDSVGNVSTMAWDSLGRKIAMTDPDVGSWSYGYDAAGHLISQTDGAGRALTMTYADPLGRLTSRSAGATVLATYSYDQAGHGAGLGEQTSMTDTSGSTSWTYDTLGRVISTTETIGGVPYTVGQAYDTAGRRKSLTYPDGEVVAYGYDAAGCQTSLGAYVTAATCTPTSSSQTLGDGVLLSQTLNPNRLWLANDTAAKGTTVLQNENYTYRADALIATKTSADAADQWTYKYDNFGRLTTATNTTTAAYNSAYSYDKLGRILTGTGAGARVYPAVGAGHSHAPSTVGGVAFTYDGAGNLTQDATTAYTYDSQNRLATTTTAGVTTAYTDNGLGVRVKAGATTYVELNGQLLYQTNGTASSDFFYYGTQRIARKDSTGAVSYYVANQLGSPHLTLDATGTVTRTAEYSPYGAILAQSGTAGDSFGLAGDVHDPAALYKRGVRSQDQNTGLFTSPDVSGHVDPTAPQTLNRYAYAANDPVNFVDHTGEQRKEPLEGPPVSVIFGDKGSVSGTVDVSGKTVSFQPQHGDEAGQANVGASVPLYGGLASVDASVGVRFQDGAITGGQGELGFGAGIPYVINASVEGEQYFTVKSPEPNTWIITGGVEASVKGNMFGLPGSEKTFYESSGPIAKVQYWPNGVPSHQWNMRDSLLTISPVLQAAMSVMTASGYTVSTDTGSGSPFEGQGASGSAAAPETSATPTVFDTPTVFGTPGLDSLSGSDSVPWCPAPDQMSAGNVAGIPDIGTSAGSPGGGSSGSGSVFYAD